MDAWFKNLDYGDYAIDVMWIAIVIGMIAGIINQERRMSRHEERSIGKKVFWWAFFAVYLMATTLTAGNAWHGYCADSQGRWPCSAFLGAIWPVTLLSKFGIWAMDPTTQWPSISISTEPKR